MIEKIKEMPMEQRPREKAVVNGVGSLSNKELVTLLIRTGTKDRTCMEIAEDVLDKCRCAGGLECVSLEELMSIRGISKAKAIELLACVEISKRINYEKIVDKNPMKNPGLLVDWLKLELGKACQERFMVLYLNNRLCLKGYETLFMGTYDSSLVDIQLVLKKTLDRRCQKIVLVHNHPSGSLEPSSEDRLMTQRIKQGACLLGIEVVDHLVVSDGGYYSFKENGEL